MAIFINLEDAREMAGIGVGTKTIDWEGFDYNLECVHEEIIGTSRWSVQHQSVWKDLDSGAFYETTYQVGATECQDEGPYEWEDGPIEFTEVKAVQKTTTVYEAI